MGAMLSNVDLSGGIQRAIFDPGLDRLNLLGRERGGVGWRHSIAASVRALDLLKEQTLLRVLGFDPDVRLAVVAFAFALRAGGGLVDQVRVRFRLRGQYEASAGTRAIGLGRMALHAARFEDRVHLVEGPFALDGVSVLVCVGGRFLAAGRQQADDPDARGNEKWEKVRSHGGIGGTMQKGVPSRFVGEMRRFSFPTSKRAAQTTMMRSTPWIHGDPRFPGCPCPSAPANP